MHFKVEFLSFLGKLHFCIDWRVRFTLNLQVFAYLVSCNINALDEDTVHAHITKFTGQYIIQRVMVMI